jgi:hypothetical protein
MTDRPLSESQVRVLDAMRRLDHMGALPATPATIAREAGFDKVVGGRGEGGRGRGHRVFNPAQRIIPALTGLRRRGMIRDTRRRDGMSGVAYDFT